MINKEKGERKNETFSEIMSPPITDTANTQDNVEELALPAHLLYNSPSAARGEEDVEDKKNDVY